MNRLRIVLLGSLLLGSLPSAATAIYRHVDEYGNVSYSDQPQQGAESVDIPPPNLTPALRPSTPAPTATELPERTTYQQLTITTPTCGGVIPPGGGNFSVTIALQPALRPQDRWRLQLDGQTVYQGRALNIGLQQVPRGNHQLQAEVIDAQQQVLLRSDSCTVFVMRPSTQFRN